MREGEQEVGRRWHAAPHYVFNSGRENVPAVNEQVAGSQAKAHRHRLGLGARQALIRPGCKEGGPGRHMKVTKKL